MASHDPRLVELGWKSFFNKQISSEEDVQCRPVRVMAVHRGKIAVAGAGIEELISPRIPGADAEEHRPAAGDWLLIDRESLQPTRILRRASLFKRIAAGGRQKQQVVAANVDTVFIVASCNQDFNIARLERYLVLAREVGVNPVLVLTKMDLADQPERFAEAARRLQPDLAVETVNARDAGSVARLAAWCGPGQTVALLGSSGVGKSTLVNTLRASDSIATQAVREEDGRGRHTTTVREMHRLDRGGWLLDTPGMRELQLSDAASGLAEVFDDIVALTQQCRFSNCTHEAEPGCSVLAAMAQGQLERARLDRWRKLASEDSANSERSATRRERADSAENAAQSHSKNPGKRPWR
jgi:ribosome biogenesis GTPase / thiamine phosphate phosphatase